MRESGWSADIMRPCKRGSFVGLLLCLLIFAWTGAQPPVAHAAGRGSVAPRPKTARPISPQFTSTIPAAPKAHH